MSNNLMVSPPMKGKIFIYPDRSYLVVLEGGWSLEQITHIKALMDDWRWSHVGTVIAIPDGVEVHFVNP